jgi:geranylgeranyl diphosphate synthase, type II
VKRHLPAIRESLLLSIPQRFPIDDPRNTLADAMKYSIQGGKHIRPLFVLATYQLLRGSSANIEKILPLAVSIEMVHAFSLIQDDLPCMDNDTLRRGQATTHVKFQEDMAILTGDQLLFRVFGILSRDLRRTEAKPGLYTADRVLDLQDYLGSAFEELVEGQVLDLRDESVRSKSREDQFEYLKSMHSGKTGAMIRAAIVGPAIIEGESRETIATLEEYAGCLGRLFQITDDILDATKNTEELGKTAGKDESQDKLTYVTFLGIEGAMREAEKEASTALQSISVLDAKYNTALLKDLINVVLTREK